MFYILCSAYILMGHRVLHRPVYKIGLLPQIALD